LRKIGRACRVDVRMIKLMTRRDARSLDHATLEEMRRLGVKRVLEGETQVAVAQSLDIHPRTVAKWMRTYREEGERALASTKATGRPPKLTVAQQRKCERVIIGKNPRQLNFGSALWTLPVVSDFIAQTFGIVLHTTTVSRMLHRMGITPQKPVRRSFHRDDDECLQWMQTEFPKIVRRSKRRQSVILFSDETGVHEDHPVGRSWARRGETPVVRTKGSRRRINVISAISPRGRLWFRCFKGTLTAGLFVVFLKALLSDVRGSIELVLDRHPAHTAASTKRFLAAHSDRITVHWLPAYAPDLNPSEHIWSWLKGTFRNLPLDREEDLEDAVLDSMTRVRNDRKLVKGFFGHPAVAYVKQALGW